jgi:hypothetical protein
LVWLAGRLAEERRGLLVWLAGWLVEERRGLKPLHVTG